jgi:hypothetical protein
MVYGFALELQAALKVFGAVKFLKLEKLSSSYNVQYILSLNLSFVNQRPVFGLWSAKNRHFSFGV